MNELIYLGLAVAVSAIGSLVVWLRARKPTSMQAGLNDFSRSLSALENNKSNIRR